MDDESAKPRSKPNDPPKPEKDRDLVFVGQKGDAGYRVLRQRDDRVEVGEMRELRSGQPLSGEVVRLHPTEVHERLFECETLYEPEPPPKTTGTGHKGPARVSNDAYRAEWDRIFGTPDDPKDLN